MSNELDDMGLDDLDLDFEDQFPDFDDGNEDVPKGNRDPLDSIKTAGMETLKNTSTYTKAAQTIAMNALPDGYSEVASGLSTLKDLGSKTLDEAKKELGDTGNVLRDIALKHEGMASKILPNSFIEKLKEDKQREDNQDAYAKVDADQATIQAALGELFKTSVSQDAQSNEVQSTREEAVDTAKLDLADKQVSGTADIRNILSRMVSFNDNIAAGYYSKNLELQFKQYFALRDILKGNQAYYADSKTLFEGVLKNTALPDILKSTMSEEYLFQSQEALLGRVNEGINKNLGGYFDKFKDNVVNKGREFAGSIREGVSLAGDILNNDMLDDLSPSEKEELIASMAFEQAIDGVSGMVGTKLAATLKKHPDIAGLGLELLYLQNNAPFLLDELTENGSDSEIAEKLRGLKGYFDDKLAPTKALLGNIKNSISSTASTATDAIMSVLPENAKKAYSNYKESSKLDKELASDDPFADIEEKDIDTGSWYMNLIKDVLPALGDNQISFNNTLLDDGYKSVSLDLAMRNAVVDVMPGLLTEAVRQLTILNEGSDDNAISYDVNSGQFNKTSNAKDTLTNKFLSEFDARGKQQRVERIIAMLDPEGILDDDERIDVSKALITMANGFGQNKMFTYSNLLKELTGSTKEKVAELTGELDTDDRVLNAKYKSFFTREYGSLRDGFDKAQGYVNDVKIAGGAQQLINTGLLIPDPKDPTRMILNQDMFLDGVVNFEDNGEVVDRTDAIKRFRAATVDTEVEGAEPTIPDVPQEDVSTSSRGFKDYSNDLKEKAKAALEGVQSKASSLVKDSTIDDIKEHSNDLKEKAKVALDDIQSQADALIQDSPIDDVKGYGKDLKEKAKTALDSAQNQADALIQDGVSLDDIKEYSNTLKEKAKAALDSIYSQARERMQEETIGDGITSAPIDGDRSIPEEQQYKEANLNIKADVLRDALMDKLDGKEAIPVYLALEQAKAETDPIVEALITLNQTNIDSGANTHALLAQIHEAVASLESVSTGTQARVGILSSAGDFAKKSLSGAGSFFKKYYQGASMAMRSAGSMGGSLLSGAGSGLGSLASALFGKRSGKGKGENEDGVDAEGGGSVIGDILRGLGAPIASAIDFQKSIITDTIPTAFRVVKGGIKAFNDKVEDVYVGDETTPRLLASVMKRGGYFSEATKKRIYSHKDIDGNVVDKDGNVILAMDELSTGLTNRKGKPLSNGRIMDALSTAKDAGMSAVKTSFDLARRGAQLSYKVADKSVETFASWFTKKGITREKDIDPSTGLESDIPTIDLIYKHMTTKWPLSKDEIASNGDVDNNTRTTQKILEEQLEAIKMQGEADKKSPTDRDGDGYRDGSWQAKKANRTVDKDDGVKPKREQKKEERSGIMSMLAPLLGVLGTLASGLGSLVTTIGAALGAKGIMDTLGGFMPDFLRGKKGGPSKIGGIKNAAVGMGGKVLNAGKSLLGGTAAKTVGRVALQGALLGGRALLGAGAAVLSAPLGAIMAVGTAAYLGYKGAKWLAMRSDAEPLEELRFLQYGINLKQGGVMSGLRYLEEFVLDEVDIDDGKVSYSRPTNEDVIDKLNEELDLEQGDPKAVENALAWFDKRFVPVLLHHTGVAAKIDSWIDIDDIDDDIDDEDVPRFLTSIMTDEMVGSKFYKVTNSPGPGIDILDNKADVESRIVKLMKQYSKEEAAKLEKRLPSDKAKADNTKAKDSDVNEAKTASLDKPLKDDEVGDKDNKLRSDKETRAKIDKAREFKRKMIAREMVKGNVPDIAIGATFASEELLGDGTTAYKMANGDILIDTNGVGRVASIEDGVVDKFGEAKGFGKFIEVNTIDGRNIVYKNLSDIPNDLTKGKTIKAGDEIGRADKYGIGGAKGLGLNVVNNRVVDNRRSGDRPLQDAAIAAASLPMGDRDKSLKVITDTLANQNKVVENNPVTDPNEFTYSKPVPVATKPTAPRQKPVSDTRMSDMNALITGTFNYYHSNSIKQRDRMISLLEEIKTLFSTMEINVPTMQPQANAPQAKAKAPKVSVPLQFKKTTYS